MKIGIYKPAKPVYFHDQSEDHAAWSSEVVKLAHIFADRDNEVFILSDTDLEADYHPSIDTGSILDEYDRIFIFCGGFEFDEYGDSIIVMLREKTKRLDFIVTDMSLLPASPYRACRQFDNIYIQSIRSLDVFRPYPQKDGGLVQITAYGATFTNTIDEAIAQKDTDFCFGGSERRRLYDFLEFVWRPGHVVYTRSPFLDINTKVSRETYMDTMKRSFSSICIADEEYNDSGFYTHRPIECFLTDTLAFTARSYDRDNQLIPEGHWLRVNSYKEMREKINTVKENKMLHRSLLEWQREKITPDIVSGKYTYDKLK